MDKQLIEEMKEEARESFYFWREVRESSPQNTLSPHATVALTGAIQAYAALCQAEVLHDLNNPQMTDAELREIMGAGPSFDRAKFEHADGSVTEEEIILAGGNRTDQSIADALSES